MTTDLDSMTDEQVDAWIVSLQMRVQDAHMKAAVAMGEGNPSAILKHTREAGEALRQWADTCDWMCGQILARMAAGMTGEP